MYKVWLGSLPYCTILVLVSHLTFHNYTVIIYSWLPTLITFLLLTFITILTFLSVFISLSDSFDTVLTSFSVMSPLKRVTIITKTLECIFSSATEGFLHFVNFHASVNAPPAHLDFSWNSSLTRLFSKCTYFSHINYYSFLALWLFMCLILHTFSPRPPCLKQYKRANWHWYVTWIIGYLDLCVMIYVYVIVLFVLTPWYIL